MPNLKQASRLANLDSIGFSKTEFDIEDELSLLHRICGDFIKRVHSNIQKKGMNVSGKISALELEETNDGMNILAYPHLIFHDLGVNGNTIKLYDTPFTYRDKMPPVDAIKEWIKEKGLQTRNNDKYKEKKFEVSEGVAWAIAKNIQKKGMQPKDIYSKEIPQLIEDLANKLADFGVTQALKSF